MGNTDPGEIYTARLEVQVHEVEGNSTLQISMNMAESDLVADVLDPQIREARFGDSFVHSLVLANAALEVDLGLFA